MQHIYILIIMGMMASACSSGVSFKDPIGTVPSSQSSGDFGAADTFTDTLGDVFAPI
ncbi:MAG: hypothetical protein AAF701_09040 [Pseudomonadota bacterium]